MTAAERFWSKADRSGGPDACWRWGRSLDREGYGWVRIFGPVDRAHRVAWRLVYGAIPDGLCVLHTCDVPSCVNPAHLRLGTYADKTADMVRKGRQRSPRGERHPRAKLTQTQVEVIRARYIRGGVSESELAREFGVSQVAIHYIICRKNWRHLDDPEGSALV